MKYFSLSTRGFYDSTVRGVVVPDDAIELTDEQYEELYSGQSETHAIGMVNGQLATVQRTITEAELDRQTVSTQKRYLRDTDYMMTVDYDGDAAEIAVVKEKRAAARATIRTIEAKQYN